MQIRGVSRDEKTHNKQITGGLIEMNIQQARIELDKEMKTLNKESKELNKRQRKKRVNDLTEWFYNEVGQYPDSYRLSILANVLLVEEITDKKKNKIRKTEYAFLSPRQLDTRNKRESPMDYEHTMDFMYQKHTKRMNSAFKKRTRNTQEV